MVQNHESIIHLRKYVYGKIKELTIDYSKIRLKISDKLKEIEEPTKISL